MKKIIVCVLCTVLALSLLPVFTLFPAAAVEGDFAVYRNPGDYKDPETYNPAPGYHYTSEGFSLIGADYSDSHPFFTVQTKEKQSLTDGFSMTFRVDNFCYRGETNSDEWICLSIWDSVNLSPGSTAYGSGWLSLIRGSGNGQATVESSNVTATDEENEIIGSFGPHFGSKSADPEVDDQGREIYTVNIDWDGSKSLFSIKINGVEVNGCAEVSKHLLSVDNDGEFYVGLTVMSMVKDGQAELTITELNGSKPQGTDSADPEPNLLKYADIADSSEIPENMPAFLFDATKSCFNSDPTGQNMTFVPQGDNTYRVLCSATAVFFSFGPSRNISYEAKDFPVCAMMLKNYWGNGGSMYYYAGDILGPGSDNGMSWSPYDDDNEFYGDDEEFTLCLLNFDGLWEGRINGVRFDFGGLVVGDEDATFDICYIGFFRSVEEAKAYANTYVNPDAEPDTGDTADTDDADQPTEQVHEDETVADTVAETAADTVAEPAADTVADTVADDADNSQTEIFSIEDGDDASGCASLIGLSALVMALGAAFVVMKRRF